MRSVRKFNPGRAARPRRLTLLMRHRVEYRNAVAEISKRLARLRALRPPKSTSKKGLILASGIRSPPQVSSLVEESARRISPGESHFPRLRDFSSGFHFASRRVRRRTGGESPGAVKPLQFLRQSIGFPGFFPPRRIWRRWSYEGITPMSPEISLGFIEIDPPTRYSLLPPPLLRPYSNYKHIDNLLDLLNSFSRTFGDIEFVISTMTFRHFEKNHGEAEIRSFY